MSNPIYSFIASSIRDYYYKDYYWSISNHNDVPFEVIFVGPNPPKEKMPNNFIHITSDVKPGQCFEIAARNASGDYLIWAADDLRYSAGFLRYLDEYNNRLDDDRIFISFRATLQGNYVDSGMAFDLKKPTSPLIGFGGLFRRDLFHEYGGLDKRFFGSFADVDMQLRFLEAGRTIFFPPNCVFDEIKPRKHESKRTLLLYRCNVSNARPMLDSLWVNPDGSMSKTRLSSVQPYVDKDILTKDQ